MTSYLYFRKASLLLLVLILGAKPCLSQGALNRTPAQEDERIERVEDRDDPARREAWFRKGRQLLGESAAALRNRAYHQKMSVRAVQSSAAGGAGVTNRWWSLGPRSSISDPSGFQDYGLVSGRVTSIAVDQSDLSGNTVYVGAAFGGIWKSVNAADPDPNSVLWTPLSDQEATLAIGSIAIHPENHLLLLAGTGETHNSVDSYYGVGILRSTDAGASWSLISSADNGARPFQGLGFSAIVFNPEQPNIVVAATSVTNATSRNAEDPNQTLRGLYYSTDAGLTWHYATVEDPGGQTSPGSVSTVVYNTFEHKFYAALRGHGIYSSTDGVNWSRLPEQPGIALTVAHCPKDANLNTCPIFRAQLTVRPGRNEMYLIFIDPGGAFQGVFITTNGGADWEELDAGAMSVPQGFYNLYIEAIPRGEATDLFLGAVNLARCTLQPGQRFCILNEFGGFGFRNLTHVYDCNETGHLANPSHVHPDQHAIAYLSANPEIMYFGNDGGIYRSMNGLNTADGSCTAGDPFPFQNLNRNLGPLTQFVSFSQSEQAPDLLLAGSQDNGSPVVDATHNQDGGQIWTVAHGGDGGFNEIDPRNPNVWYVANTYVSIYRCETGFSCLQNGFIRAQGLNDVGSDFGDFYSPYMLDSAAPDRMIIGTCRLWRGDANKNNWNYSNAISPILDDPTQTAKCQGNEFNLVSAIATAGPKNFYGSSLIYVGTTAGRVFVSPDAWGYGSNIIDRSGPFASSGFKISSIIVDPSDATGHTAYATVMGFGVGHIWKTSDTGLHWSDISSNLPDAPADAMAIDPSSPQILYVGTDIGVYRSMDGGASWTEFGTGLPNVVVSKLRLLSVGGAKILRASTYGRGIWQVFVDVGSPGFGNAAFTFPLTVATSHAAKGVLFMNPSQSPISLQSATTSGAFTVSTPCSTVPPGGFCELAATFNPSQAGESSSPLTVTSTSESSPHTITLQGTGFELALSLSRPKRPSRSESLMMQRGQTVDVPILITTGTQATMGLEVECSTASPKVQCVIPPEVLVRDGKGQFSLALSTVEGGRSGARRLARFESLVVVRIRFGNEIAGSLSIPVQVN